MPITENVPSSLLLPILCVRHSFAEGHEVFREFREEMIGFACRGWSHSWRDRGIEQLNDGAERLIVEPKNENLKDG